MNEITAKEEMEKITIKQLKEELEALKYAYEVPRVHLVDYISRLTNTVDIAFEKYQIELDDRKSKESIEAYSSQMEIVDRIKSFEQECLDNLPTNEFEEGFSKSVLEKIQQFELELGNADALDQGRMARIRDEIRRTLLMVQKRVFMDKTVEFIDELELKVDDDLECVRRILVVVENVFVGEK